jgi:hypothetical protein
MSSSATIESKGPRASLAHAIDLLDLGMYHEGLRLIEALPAEVRERRAGCRAELRATLALGLWQRALKLAVPMKDGNEDDRISAADAFQTLAAEALKRGRETEAIKLASAAITADPRKLEALRDDERFPEMFRTRFGLKVVRF